MRQQIEHGGGHDKPEGVQLAGQRVESPGIDADERDVRRDRAQHAGVLDLQRSGSQSRIDGMSVQRSASAV